MSYVVITGANGFLGSNLVNALLDNGYKVLGLVRKGANLIRLDKLRNNPDFKLCYLEDGLDKVFINFDKLVKFAIHTATNYGNGNQSAHDVFITNEGFALKFLESCVNGGVEVFINAGTVLPKSLNYYSVAKHNFFNWGNAFSRLKKIKFLNMNIQHFYGIGDDKSRFVEFLIQSFMNGVSHIDLTLCEQSRDFIYIDDVVDAYISILGNLERGMCKEWMINIELGSGKEVILKDFVQLIKEMTNNTATQLNYGAIPYRVDEPMSSYADLTYLNKLGWRPKVDLVDGLSRCIGAYKK